MERNDAFYYMRMALQIVVSLIGGGLAGAFVSAIFNRSFHRRELRTQFYPALNDVFSAYVIRMEDPDRRYWTTVVGNNPTPEDADFVDHRSAFIRDLVRYNELKEVRVLRERLLDNMKHNHIRGDVMKFDLAPEVAALQACFAVLHKKLKP
jgi:hypothetical protein